MWICACIEERIQASWIKLDFLKTKNSCNGCQLLPLWWGCGIALAKPDRCGSQTGAAILQLVRPPGSQASPEQTDPLVAPTGFLAWQVEDRRRHCSTTEFFFLQLCSVWTVRSKSGHNTNLNVSSRDKSLTISWGSLPRIPESSRDSPLTRLLSHYRSHCRYLYSGGQRQIFVTICFANNSLIMRWKMCDILI